MAASKQIDELLRLANNYPSPHNGQPIRLRFVDNEHVELFFERSRGLQATDVSYLFSYVSMGVFAEHFILSGRALGHAITVETVLPPEDSLRGEGPILFAKAIIRWAAQGPDTALEKTLKTRQTSRRKYDKAPDAQTVQEIVSLASDAAMNLVQLDAPQTQQAIWLNQRAVFDDLFDEPVRQELDHWLRYSRAEKEQKQDGLSYDCMQINGGAMKYVVHHPRLLRTPGLSWILQQYYLRTMKDASSVLYMLAPFTTEAQSYAAGQVIMRIWRRIAEKGYSLHPFGTIMSNHQAHSDFVRMAGIKNENREHAYLVFIFRLGKSKPAVRSLRIPYEKHLLMEDN